MIYWPKEALVEIDSENLRKAYQSTMGYYNMLYKHLVDGEQSPYKDKNSLTLEVFLWAFSIVSSRHLVFNNGDVTEDPNMLLL